MSSYNNNDYSELENKFNEFFSGASITWHIALIGFKGGVSERSKMLKDKNFFIMDRIISTSQKLPNMDGGEIIVNFVVTQKR